MINIRLTENQIKGVKKGRDQLSVRFTDVSVKRVDCILFIGSRTWSPSKSLNMPVHQYKKQDSFQAFVCLVGLYFTSVTRNNSNRPFPLSRKQRHQLEAEVGKIQ